MKHINEVLGIIRNPWGHSEDEVRAARLAAADTIEALTKANDQLFRLGQANYNDAERWRYAMKNPWRFIDLLRKHVDVDKPAYWREQAEAATDVAKEVKS